MISQETIVALATPSGAGAIAVIRLSGKDALVIASKVFQSVSGKKYYFTAHAYCSLRTYS